MPDPSTRDSIAAGMSCHDSHRVNALVWARCRRATVTSPYKSQETRYHAHKSDHAVERRRLVCRQLVASVGDQSGFGMPFSKINRPGPSLK
jgi:hypothetical protein